MDQSIEESTFLVPDLIAVQIIMIREEEKKPHFGFLRPLIFVVNSVAELADRSGVSTSTIKRIEASDGVSKSTKANLAALRRTLEAAGIEFIGTPDNGPGIRIHKRGT